MNNMSHSAGRAIGIAFALFFSAVSGAFATVITTWGGDYVAAYTGLNGGTPVSPTTASKTYTYSTTVAKSPAGPTFYGAFSLSNSIDSGTAPSFMANRFGIATADGASRLQFGTTAAAGEVVMRGLVFFMKTDFLDGSSEGTVGLDDSSVFTIGVVSSGGSFRQYKMAVHAKVLGEWGWYLSQAGGVSEESFTLERAGEANWGRYEIDPANGPLHAAPKRYETFGTDFEEIDAVGYFFNYAQSAAGANTTFFVNSFSATAQVRPQGEGN